MTHDEAAELEDQLRASLPVLQRAYTLLGWMADYPDAERDSERGSEAVSLLDAHREHIQRVRAKLVGLLIGTRTVDASKGARDRAAGGSS